MTYKVNILKADNSPAEMHTFEEKTKVRRNQSVTKSPPDLQLWMAGTLTITVALQ